MKNVNTISRSTLVRERQKQLVEEKIKQSSKIVSQPPVRKAVKPMVSRHNPYSAVYPSKSHTAARRQYNYAIGATGAEIRLPAISTVHIGWRMLSFFLAIFCLVGILTLVNSAEFQIANIQTNGITRLSTINLDAVLKIKGESIATIDASQAKKDLEIAFPELKDIQVSLELPNSISISAVERQPVLLWQTENQSYWVDAEGVLIPPRGEVGDLLTIHASSAPPVSTPLTDQSLSALQKDKQSAGETDPFVAQLQFWGQSIDPGLITATFDLTTYLAPSIAIRFDPIHGLGWRAEEGWDVYIGLTLDDISYKLNVYQKIIEKISSKGKNPSIVSIEFATRPYYRE